MRPIVFGCVVVALAAPAEAHAGGPKYRFVSDTVVTMTATSDCAPGEGGVRTAETLVWEIKSRQTGVSEVGDGTDDPKGSTKLTGTIRRETTRQYEGSDPTTQGGTEPMQESVLDHGVLHRFARGRLELRLSHGGLPDPVFAALPRGKSKIITQKPAPLTSTHDNGRCVDTDRTETVRRITVTRVR